MSLPYHLPPTLFTMTGTPTPAGYTDALVATSHLMACERMSKGFVALMENIAMVFRGEMAKEKPNSKRIAKVLSEIRRVHASHMDEIKKATLRAVDEHIAYVVRESQRITKQAKS